MAWATGAHRQAWHGSFFRARTSTSPPSLASSSPHHATIPSNFYFLPAYYILLLPIPNTSSVLPVLPGLYTCRRCHCVAHDAFFIRTAWRFARARCQCRYMPLPPLRTPPLRRCVCAGSARTAAWLRWRFLPAAAPLTSLRITLNADNAACYHRAFAVVRRVLLLRACRVYAAHRSVYNLYLPYLPTRRSRLVRLVLCQAGCGSLLANFLPTDLLLLPPNRRPLTFIFYRILPYTTCYLTFQFRYRYYITGSSPTGWDKTTYHLCYDVLG